MSKITLLQGDALEVLKTLPDKSVHCCICSPPFYGLRDYGTGTWVGGDANCKHQVSSRPPDSKAKRALEKADVRPGWDMMLCRHCGAKRIDQQLGLESSAEDYIARLVEVFGEARRVLRDDGTLWLNLGDTFWAGKSKKGAYKPKDLMMIPARVAIALQQDGWYLRQDIIWFAPNKKPESVQDRPTISHEHVFLLAKQRFYYYDNEAVKVEGAGTLPWGNKRNFKQVSESAAGRHGKTSMFAGGTKQEYIDKWYSDKVQRRSVWSIPTKPYKGAHFAPFPEALVEPCLLAGTSERGCCPACGAPWKRIVEKENPAHDGDTESAYEKGTSANRLAILRQAARGNGEEYTNRTKTVGWQPSCKCPGDLEPIACTAIDPFMGSGTVGAVCVKHHRDFIGIDLSADYVTLAEERIGKVQPLLMEML